MHCVGWIGLEICTAVLFNKPSTWATLTLGSDNSEFSTCPFMIGARNFLTVFTVNWMKSLLEICVAQSTSNIQKKHVTQFSDKNGVFII